MGLSHPAPELPCKCDMTGIIELGTTENKDAVFRECGDSLREYSRRDRRSGSLHYYIQRSRLDGAG